MKQNHLFILLFLCASLAGRAQITQGRLTTGDHPRHDILEILNNKSSRSFSFSPSLGYFLTDNFLLGAGFSASNVREINSIEIDFFEWSLAPFARYYFPGNFFLTAGMAVGNQRRDISQWGVQDRITFYRLSAGAGKDFFLRGDVALEGVAWYEYGSFSGESLADDETYNSLVVDFNLQPFLGAGLNADAGNPLGAGSLLLDLPARMQWIGPSVGDAIFRLSLAPRIGYFFTDSFVAGGQVSLSIFSSEGETEFGFGLSPLLRYYLPPLSESLYAFGTISAGFERNPGADDPVWSGYFGPGLDFFLSPNVALEGLLAYSFLKRDGAPALERAMIRAGVQIFLRREN